MYTRHLSCGLVGTSMGMTWMTGGVLLLAIKR